MHRTARSKRVPVPRGDRIRRVYAYYLYTFFFFFTHSSIICRYKIYFIRFADYILRYTIYYARPTTTTTAAFCTFSLRTPLLRRVLFYNLRAGVPVGSPPFAVLLIIFSAIKTRADIFFQRAVKRYSNVEKIKKQQTNIYKNSGPRRNQLVFSFFFFFSRKVG